MESHYSISNLFIIRTLYPGQQLDCNPLLLALHQRRHDFVHAFFIEPSRLDVVDVFFVIVARLLLPRSLRNSGIPSISVVNTKSLDNGIRQLGAPFRLRLATDVAGAVRLTAVARLRLCSIPIDVVVECELFTSLYFAFGEDAHAETIANHPFVDIAIRITRMIAKPTQISLLRGVDEFAFVEGHEVEVLDAFIIVLLHPLSEGVLANDLANVLVYEVVSSQIGLGSQAIAFLFGFDNGDVHPLFSLEALILACRPTTAIAHALHFGGAIDAIRILATGMIGMGRGVCERC